MEQKDIVQSNEELSAIIRDLTARIKSLEAELKNAEGELKEAKHDAQVVEAQESYYECCPGGY